MAVPKFKKSRSNTRTRRSQWKASAAALVACPQCKSEKLSHRACPVCGAYKGKTYNESIRKEYSKA